MNELLASIADAITSGALALAKGVATDGIKEAYGHLRKYLSGRLHSLLVVEESPADDIYRNALVKEIEQKALTNDLIFLKLVKELAAAIEHLPEADAEISGVSIRGNSAEKNIIIKHINAVQTIIEQNTAGGSIEISDVGPKKNA